MQTRTPSRIKSHIAGRTLAQIQDSARPGYRPGFIKKIEVGDAFDVAQEIERMAQLGICFDAGSIQALASLRPFGDAAPTPAVLPTGAIVPRQFLQYWLPGYIAAMAQIRQADRVYGSTTIGEWWSEEIVITNVEPLTNVEPYAIGSNVPLASYQDGFTNRQVYRAWTGMRVNKLIEERVAAMLVSVSDENIRRQAMQVGLDMLANKIAFNGISGTTTYGAFNDPALPAATALPNGASGAATWASKTYLEIQADIILIAAAIRTRTGSTFDPMRGAWVLSIAPSTMDALNKTTSFGGVSVLDWIKSNYPGCRIEIVPENAAAVTGQNLVQAFAESVQEEMTIASTDDRATWLHAVPARSVALGVETKLDGWLTGTAMATAGMTLKRPLNVVQYYGN